MLLALATLPALGATLEPEVGVAQTQLSDHHQSPLPYSAQGFRPGLRFSAEAGRVRFVSHVAGNVGSARAMVDRPSLGETWIDGALTLGTDVAVFSGDLTTLRIGGSVSNRTELIDGMAGHVWGLGTTALAATARVEQRVGRLQVALDVSVPVVSVVTRHNWSLDPIVPNLGDVPAFYTVGSRLAVVGQFIDVRARGEVAVGLGERHAWVVGAGATYFGYPDPAPVRRLGLNVVTGPRFRLGGA